MGSRHGAISVTHNTTHAVQDMITAMYDNISKNDFSCILALDLKEAFDAVNHKILLQNLSIMEYVAFVITSFLIICFKEQRVLYVLTKYYPLPNIFYAMNRKALFWDYYCFLFTLMISIKRSLLNPNITQTIHVNYLE